MNYPILAPSNTWYKSNTLRNVITEINIVDNYIPTGSESETWNADVNNNGSIKCYINGTKLTIAGNGSGKIVLNEDSSYLFSGSYTVANNYSYLFASCKEINGLNLLDSSQVINLSYAFAAMKSLTEIDVSTFNVSNVENMYMLFSGYNSARMVNLKNIIGIKNWDVSNVTNMQSMFSYCESLTNIDISTWDTRNVTNMTGMFMSCSSLTTLDISKWDTSSVTSMYATFRGCTSLTTLDVSNLNVNNVTNMKNMFSCGNDYGQIPMKITTLDVSKWNTSSVTDMSFMFYGCKGPKTIDVSNWDVSKVTTFDHMFSHSYLTVIGVENWKNTIVTNLECTFHSVMNDILDLSGLRTSNCISFGGMFKQYGSNLTKIIGLEYFDTSAGLDFGDMFYGCTKIRELDLSSFDTTNAKPNVVTSSNGTTSKVMENFFYEMYNLKKVTFGNNFSFNGDGSSTVSSHTAKLPVPNSDYISGADGYWYTYNGIAYTTDNIPNRTACVYYAINQNNADYIVSGKTLIDIANSIREKTGMNDSLSPNNMATAIRSINNNSFRIETGSVIIENDIKSSSSTTLLIHNVICPSGAKLFTFQADDNTFVKIKAKTDAYYTIGITCNFANSLIDCSKNGLIHVWTGSKAAQGGVVAENNNGVSFDSYWLTAGTYNWIAYYWND